jgi:RnfABCDGE-type electron transport complex G subunit
VIIGNLLTPLIDTYIVEKPYAYRKNALRGLREDSGKPWWKRIPKPVIALTLITAIAGVALSGVYSMTKDTIDAQKEAAKLESYKIVAGDADAFRAIEQAEEMITGSHKDGVYHTTFGRVKINEVYEAVDEAGNAIGTVMSITSSDGFDGDVTLALGLDADGKVTGIAFTELHETPGMGMRADEDGFKGQFAGQDSVLVLVKGEADDDGEIAAISGATITSTAVTNAVSAGLHFYQNVIKGAK